MTRDPAGRRTAAVAAAFMGIAAAIVACSGLGSRESVPIEDLGVRTVGCSAVVSAQHSAVQQGEPPACSARSWRFVLGPTDNPATIRRSELFLMSTGEEVTGESGDRLTFEADLRAHLGSAASADDAWHLLWQLHGPVGDRWAGPAVSLLVRDGGLKLVGGAGAPGQDWLTRNYEWNRQLAPYVDDRKTRLRIEVQLGGPDHGWVSAWVDGRAILKQWRPESLSGLRPGTIYDGQDAVAMRMGLYRGTQGGAPPKHEQWVEYEVLVATSHHRPLPAQG